MESLEKKREEQKTSEILTKNKTINMDATTNINNESI